MWLNKIAIINYKSCQLLTYPLHKDVPNVLVGINDSGKTTILHALDLLLGKRPFNFETEDKKKSDISNIPCSKSDVNTFFFSQGLPIFEYQEDRCMIIGSFKFEEEELESPVVTKYSPQMQWLIEHMEAGEELHYMKVYLQKERKSEEYILIKDAIESALPMMLYNQPATFLKKKVEEMSIAKDDIKNINGEGRFSNYELIKAIYNKLHLLPTWAAYSIAKDKNLFPEYAYHDWNYSLDQIQTVAKTAIKNNIGAHVSTVEKIAAEQRTEAQKIVDKTLVEFTKKFAADLPNIKAFKSNIMFNLKTELTDILISKTNTLGDDVHLDSQGEGIKRQIWFSLLKWAATEAHSGTSRKQYLWCFDEPETHLYPKAQRDFFEVLKRISKDIFQTVISTHSTVFIDRAHFTSITKVELQKGITCCSLCNSTQDVFEALQIRNSDFLFYDKFLVVEGDTEEALLPAMYKKLTKRSLLTEGVQIINLGGKDSGKQNKQLRKVLLHDYNKKEENIIYLFDNDAEFTTKELQDIKHYKLGIWDIEDSISNRVWVNIVSNKLAKKDISVTEEEVQSVKDALPNKKPASNQKFYKAFKTYLKKKLSSVDEYYIIDDALPDKGKQSGQLIAEFIQGFSDIDPNIKNAFDELT
jgi:putative ATP-dependent endonuclease of the OLD family